jgi:hypothetical protein
MAPRRLLMLHPTLGVAGGSIVRLTSVASTHPPGQVAD